MKIIRPYARIIGNPQTREEGIDLLRFVESAARISHRSEDAQTPESYDRFLRSVVLGHGDWSVTEHRIVTVEFVIDRGVSHELVRHRLFGFTQESTRFVNYEKKMPPSFIYPQVSVECELCLGGNQPHVSSCGTWGHVTAHSGVNRFVTCKYHGYWLDAVATSEEAYRRLIAGGWRPQEARSVFPTGLATKLWVTGNLRNWRHAFLMRTTNEAHPQFVQVMEPLLAEFKEKIPILYEDIEPNHRQIDNMRKPR